MAPMTLETAIPMPAAHPRMNCASTERAVPGMMLRILPKPWRTVNDEAPEHERIRSRSPSRSALRVGTEACLGRLALLRRWHPERSEQGSAQAENGQERYVDSPQFCVCEVTDQLARSSGVHCTELLDYDTGGFSFDLGLGPKRRCSCTSRCRSDDDERLGQELVGLDYYREAIPAVRGRHLWEAGTGGRHLEARSASISSATANISARSASSTSRAATSATSSWLRRRCLTYFSSAVLVASDWVRPAASSVRKALSASSSSPTDVARATHPVDHGLYHIERRTSAHGHTPPLAR